jgi:hypothetical protein
MEEEKYTPEQNPAPEHEIDFNIHLQEELEKQMREEELFEQAIRNGDILPPDVEEIPITEEELFMQILEDERNESLEI